MRRSLALVGIPAVMGVIPAMLGAGSAVADDVGTLGSNIRVRTTDADPGGEGYFYHDGERLKACDIQADGHGAIAYMWYYKNGQWNYWGYASEGGAGGCQTKDASFTEGRDIAIQVCLYKDGNYNKFCSPIRYGEA